MSGPYAIADRLPIAAREAACAATYRALAGEDEHRRDESGRCPLGVALEHAAPRRWGSPEGTEVAWALGHSDEEVAAVYPEAEAFIRDWDRGAITNLRAALGVES